VQEEIASHTRYQRIIANARRILGVTKDATREEIRAAYWVLAMKYHPDRNPRDKSLPEKFAQLAEAYEVLTNPKKLERYCFVTQEEVSPPPAPDQHWTYEEWAKEQFFELMF